MQIHNLDDAERRAFEAFCLELSFGGRVQLSKGERVALERCWLAAHQYLKPAIVLVRA